MLCNESPGHRPFPRVTSRARVPKTPSPLLSKPCPERFYSGESEHRTHNSNRTNSHVACENASGCSHEPCSREEAQQDTSGANYTQNSKQKLSGDLLVPATSPSRNTLCRRPPTGHPGTGLCPHGWSGTQQEAGATGSPLTATCGLSHCNAHSPPAPPRRASRVPAACQPGGGPPGSVKSWPLGPLHFFCAPCRGTSCEQSWDFSCCGDDGVRARPGVQESLPGTHHPYLLRRPLGPQRLLAGGWALQGPGLALSTTSVPP